MEHEGDERRSFLKKCLLGVESSIYIGKLGNKECNEALELIKAGKNKAKEIEVSMVIVVADTGGNLVAQQRIDNSLLVSINVVLNKVYSAVAVKVPTDDLGRCSGVSTYG